MQLRASGVFLAVCLVMGSGCTFYVPEAQVSSEGERDFRKLVGARGSEAPIQPGVSKDRVTELLGVPAEAGELNVEASESYDGGRRIRYVLRTIKAYRWPEPHPFLSATELYRRRFLLLTFDPDGRLLEYVVVTEPYFMMDAATIEKLSAFRQGKPLPTSASTND